MAGSARRADLPSLSPDLETKMTTSWLALFRKLHPPLPSPRSRRQRRRAKKIPAARPRLETLEERSVPSTVTWVGGSGTGSQQTDWNFAANWSTGRLPGSGDDVVINSSTNTTVNHAYNNVTVRSLTLGSADTLNWSFGTLTVSGTSPNVNGTVNLSGGTWTGPGNMTLGGLLTWTGGTLGGTGTTTANAGIALNGSNTSETLDGRTLVNANAQTITWSGTSNNLYIQDGAVLSNPASSTFNVTADNSVYGPVGVSGTFRNAGTFTKSGTTGTTEFNYGVLFNNSGTVNVNGGTLKLDAGGTDSAGSFAVTSGATLDFNGGTTLLGSSIGTSTVAQPGNVVFSGNEVTDVTGTYNVSGSTTVSGGTAKFAGPLVSLGPTVTLSGGTANVTRNVSVANLNVTGGTLTGPSTVTVTGALTWNNNGQMTGSGTTTVNATATLSLGGAGTAQTLDGRTLNNYGTATWQPNSGALNIQDGATFNNKAGATFNDYPNGTVHGSGATGSFNNAGTFTKQPTPAAGGTTDFSSGVLFNNAGTVNVASGVLELDGGGNDTGGSFTVAAGTTLNFNGGITHLASAIGTSTAAQPGTVHFSGGSTEVVGTYNVATTTIDSGATVKFFVNVSLPTVNLGNGTLAGNTAVTITKQLTWNNNGVMNGTGSTTVNAGATLSLGGDGTAQTLDARTFTNSGTATWQVGSGALNIQDGAVFNNRATFNDNTDSTVAGSGVTGAFNNSGTFTKSGTTGTTDFSGALFNNTGTVNVNGGTLQLDVGGSDRGGSFAVASGSTLDFNGGLTTLASAIGTASVAQPGTVVFSGGTTDLTGVYNVATTTIGGGATANFDRNVSLATVNLYNGTLTGPAAVAVTKQLTWGDFGVMNGTGSTTVNAGAALSLGGDFTPQTLDARTFTNSGAATWQVGSGAFDIEDGAVFNNKGTFTDKAEGLVQGSGATGVFNNSGTFTRTLTSGVTEFYSTGVQFNNTGTVNVASGILKMDGGGNDTAGSFAVASGATLDFNGGTTHLGSNIGTSTVAQPGNVVFSAGTTDVAGTYNVSGSTTVSGGTATFAGTLVSLGSTVTFSGGTADVSQNVTIPTLNLTGGTLTGVGAVTVTTGLTWNAYGQMTGTGSTTVNAGATFALGGDGSYETLDGRTFNNNSGTASWLSGSGNLNLYDGATFNNNGTFTDNTDSTVYGLGATGVFNNNGTFTKATTTGTTEFYLSGLQFNNAGTVNVTSGTLQLDGGGTSPGAWAVSSGADLVFNGGLDNLNSAGSSVTGAGTVKVQFGEVDFGGTYNVTGGTVLSGGTGAVADFLSGGSTGTFTSSGTLALGTGTTFTVTGGNYTQTGNGVTYLNGGTLAVAGGAEVDIQQYSYLYGPGTINGNLSNAGYLYVDDGNGTTGTLTVNGNYTQTSVGTLYMNIGGQGAGLLDQLNVSGSASLGGSLVVNYVFGYSPASGTPFTIMTYASHSGDFANKFGVSSGTPGATSYVVTA
jgi:hypothetical protein